MKKQNTIIFLGLFLVILALLIIIPSSYAINNDDLSLEILNINNKNNISEITIKLTKKTDKKINTNNFKLSIKDKLKVYNEDLYIGEITDSKIIKVIISEHIGNNIKLSYTLGE